MMNESTHQEARKTNLDAFRKRAVPILIVTDLAARGIDIPLLDHVVNYSFPPSPKLFVHRVGRTARQGRTGLAVSLVEPEDMPYMVDLHLFLGLPLRHTYTKPTATAAAAAAIASSSNGRSGSGQGGAKKRHRKSGDKDESEEEEDDSGDDSDSDTDDTDDNEKDEEEAGGKGGEKAAVSSAVAVACGYAQEAMTPGMAHYGSLPQAVLDAETESVRCAIDGDATGSLSNLLRVCDNAMKQYKRTRPDPSAASIHRAKQLPTHAIHPLVIHYLDRVAAAAAGNAASASFATSSSSSSFSSLAELSTASVPTSGAAAAAAADFLHSLGKFRPKVTVFEVDAKRAKASKALDGAGSSGGAKVRIFLLFFHSFVFSFLGVRSCVD